MNAIVTTPSGTFTVRLPRTWRTFRPVRAGELLKDCDRVVTRRGCVLPCGPSFFRVQGSTLRVGQPGKFPAGYYFRPLAKA